MPQQPQPQDISPQSHLFEYVTPIMKPDLQTLDEFKKEQNCGMRSFDTEFKPDKVSLYEHITL